MKLTSEKALEILNNSRGMAQDDHWIEHSICVGEIASIVAKALGMDTDKAKAMGLVHDIGKRNGFDKSHTIGGYEYLKDLGIDDEYASVCLTHSYLNNDINCVAGGLPNKNKDKFEFVKNFVENHKYDDYDKLINLCDLLCSNKVMILERRIIEIALRRGFFSNSVYHITEAEKLKKYFDEKLGYNLYKLFPDIELNEI